MQAHRLQFVAPGVGHCGFVAAGQHDGQRSAPGDDADRFPAISKIGVDVSSTCATD